MPDDIFKKLPKFGKINFWDRVSTTVPSFELFSERVFQATQTLLVYGDLAETKRPKESL